MHVLSDTVHTAAKTYFCNACQVFNDASYGPIDLTPEDRLIYGKCESDGFKILAGTKYRKIVYFDDGQMNVFRGGIEMDRMCSLLGLYDD
jgi:hypothetical protein